MSWFKVTTAEKIPMREGRSVQLGRHEIAIFHLPEKFVAIDNRCPHNLGPLCDGITKGTKVVCPLHGWNVCLETGKVVQPDMPLGVATYPVRVVDGVVEIQLNAAKTVQGQAAPTAREGAAA